MTISIHIEASDAGAVQAELAKLLAGTAGVGVPAEKSAEEPKSEPRKATTKKTEAKKTEPEPEKATDPEEPATENATPEESKTEKEVELTLDGLRKMAVRWVNDAEKTQEKRRELFQALLKKFGAAKFQEIVEADYRKVYDYICEQREASGLSADRPDSD